MIVLNKFKCKVNFTSNFYIFLLSLDNNLIIHQLKFSIFEKIFILVTFLLFSLFFVF